MEDFFLSLNEVKKILKENQIILKKSLGQNFLVDKNALLKIRDYINPDYKNVYLEIGGGLLSLSTLVSAFAKKVYVFEIDKRFKNIHKELLDKVKPNLEVFYEDALKISWCNFLNERENSKETGFEIFGNLPYCISSPVLFKLIQETCIKKATFLLQKEFQERIMAKPSTKDYGSLSVVSQIFFEVLKLKDFTPKIFFPQPKIYSSLVEFKRKDLKENGLNSEENIEKFLKFTQLFFQNRRKKILYFFKKIYKDEKNFKEFIKKNIDFNLRAENFPKEEILQIFFETKDDFI